MIPPRLRELPLIRVKKAAKRPVTSVYDVQDAAVIEDWIAVGGNAAVALVETDVLVVDVDAPELGREAAELLPETFTVDTPNGLHLYYSCQEWARNTELGGKGSIRSDGWIAVIPPSKHPDGGRYRVQHDRPIAVVERWQLEELVDEFDQDDGSGHPAPRAAESKRAGDLDDLDELIHHDGYRAKVREVLEDPNAGHDRRVWLAGFLADGVGLSGREVVNVIAKHNKWSNFDRETTRRQVRSVMRGGGE